MKNFLLTLTFAVFAFTASACWEPEDPDPQPYDGENPFQPIELTTKQAGLVRTGNAFSLNLIHRVDSFQKSGNEKDKSWFISPLSLQFALGMLLNGAQEGTAAQICQTLGYSEGQTDEVNALCKLLLERLPEIDRQTELKIADAIFYNKNVSLLPSFEKAVQDNYSAGLQALDFTKTKASAGTINKWCSDQTKGMIPSVIDEVDPAALAYLVNAIYFKSQWADKFPKSATEKETFTYENGGKDKLPMMKLQEKRFSYNENDVCQMVCLPYGNGAFSMTVLLPKKGHTVSDVAAMLDKDGVPYGRETIVDLWLPRFETKYHILLNDILCDMGMPGAFNPMTANFLAMSKKPSHIDFVQQDAVIKVDEEGSEAAAVTVIGMKFTSAVPQEPKRAVFHADHPFLYLITEASTGSILFAGEFTGK